MSALSLGSPPAAAEDQGSSAPVSPSARVQSLQHRGSPLASPHVQRSTLLALDLSKTPYHGDFQEALRRSQSFPLRPAALEIFQINVGKLCNMTCRHCHVDAGPDRTREMMDKSTVEACLRLLAQTSAHTVDLTGGAPELHPHFRDLVDACVGMGRHVIDRCNLTILLTPRCEDLPLWLAQRGVEIVCSLPHYRKRGTDAQRGDGTYERSLEALKRLNAVGYGQGDPKRRLTVMANPVGAFLPGDQGAMEREWKDALFRKEGISFDRLICLTNMPISRYLEWLEDSGNLQRYMEILVQSFNPQTIQGLMCRTTLSIAWDGRIFDCDFNQMLDLEVQIPGVPAPSIHEVDLAQLAARSIVVDRHCFGCTAGSGSSCGGAIRS